MNNNDLLERLTTILAELDWQCITLTEDDDVDIKAVVMGPPDIVEEILDKLETPVADRPVHRRMRLDG